MLLNEMQPTRFFLETVFIYFWIQLLLPFLSLLPRLFLRDFSCTRFLVVPLNEFVVDGSTSINDVVQLHHIQLLPLAFPDHFRDPVIQINGVGDGRRGRGCGGLGGN